MPQLTPELLALAGKLVFHLSAARKKAMLLPTTHAYVAAAIKDLYDILKYFLNMFPSTTVSFVEGEVFVQGNLLPHESLAYGEFLAELAERNLASVTFERDVALEELATFVGLSNLKPEEIRNRGGWEQLLRDGGVQHIRLGPLPVPLEAVLEHGAADRRVPNELYRSVLEAIVNSFLEVRESNVLDLAFLENQVKLLVAGTIEQEEVLQRLTTLKSKHEYTFYHSVNVAILTLLMVSRLRLDQATLHAAGVAALLHDVGKMRVPQEILDKPSGLTDDEWRIMQSHSLEGARILSAQRGITPLAPVVAAQHHARHDLGGYPKFNGLDRLHLLSEIVAVADTYDALTSDRSYRGAMMPDRALRIVAEGRGVHFHPTMVKLFAHLSGMYPVGSVVQLDTGETGIVVQANPSDLIRPKVKLIQDKASSIRDLPVIDLAGPAPEGGIQRSIVKSIDPTEFGVRPSDYLVPASGG